MSLHQFEYKLQDVELNPTLIATLMGYAEEDIPQEITDTIKSEIERFPLSKEVQAGYCIKPCKLDLEENFIEIEHQRFLPGRKLLKLLKPATEMAVFVCTAGNYIYDRSKQLMAEGMLLEGYIVDVMGSTLVENAMDMVHKEINRQQDAKSLKTTNRYSPGYCDWLVVEQRKLFSLLPENFCGITLSDSALMSPIKSVSGFIGIGENVKHRAYTCAMCSSTECLYRNIKTQKKTPENAVA